MKLKKIIILYIQSLRDITKPAELINLSLVITAVVLIMVHCLNYQLISRLKIGFETHSEIGRKKRRNSLMIAQDEYEPLVKSPVRLSMDFNRIRLEPLKDDDTPSHPA